LRRLFNNNMDIVRDMGRKPILGERASYPSVVRLPDEIERRIDAYARTMGIATRSEAIRSLVQLGLATHYEAERKRALPKRSRTKRGGD
jgi:Arc/MetJ-type ribon-helix-helix transcriptional regulator